MPKRNSKARHDVITEEIDVEPTAPVAPIAVDPFDPAALRLSQNFEQSVGVKRELIRVPVRKPTRQEFFRVHPDPAYRVDTAVLEFKEDRSYFLIAPALRGELIDEIVPVTLFTAVGRDGTAFLIPVKLPTESTRRGNTWAESLREVCELAMKKWVRIYADMAAGGYQALVAPEGLSDPEWPDLTLHELLKKAFGSQLVDRPDHEVIQRLQGRL